MLEKSNRLEPALYFTFILLYMCVAEFPAFKPIPYERNRRLYTLGLTQKVEKNENEITGLLRPKSIKYVSLT